MAVLRLKDLLNLVNVILLECTSKKHNCDDLRIFHVYLRLSGFSVVDLRATEDARQDDILKDCLSSGVATLLIVLETLKHLI